jgi:hypothetical protein
MKPQRDKDHQPADRRHIVGELEKADLLAGHLLIKTHGHRSAGGAEQGDDGAGPGDIGHADKDALAELGRAVVIGVEGVDGHEQGEHGGRHRRMGHEVGEGRGHDEAAEIDHAGLLADDGQHLVGHALGQAALGEYQADDDGAEDKEHRGVHEVLEGHLGLADEKHRLGHADGDAGDADGQNLEDPPGGGQGEDRQSTLAFVAEGEVLAHRVDGIRPGGE